MAFLVAAGFGYFMALDGAGVASPNVAPIKQAQSSSEYRVVWFGNFTAARTIAVVCTLIGLILAFVTAAVRHAENKRIRRLYRDLAGKKKCGEQ